MDHQDHGLVSDRARATGGSDPGKGRGPGPATENCTGSGAAFSPICMDLPWRPEEELISFFLAALHRTQAIDGRRMCRFGSTNKHE
jgi:hypothetical protein